MKKKLIILGIIIISLTILWNAKSKATHIETIDFEGSYSTDDLAGKFNPESISIENNNGMQNSRCLKLTNDDFETTQASVIFKNLDNNTRYYITAYIKTNNITTESGEETNNAGASIWANTIGVSGFTSSKRIYGTTEYNQITLSVYPTNGEIRVLSEIRNAKGEAYIDNIEISSKDAINLISNKGNILLKVDQDIINEIGKDNLQNWVENMQIAYDDLYELTTVRPETRNENGPIILDILLTDDEKKEGAAAYSQKGGVIYAYKSSMMETFKEIIERDREWIFGMLHELGHQFNFNQAWNFEQEAGTDFIIAYIAEKENLKTAPPEVPDDVYEEIYNNGGTIIDIMEYLSEYYGFLGEPSLYDGEKYKNCSPFGNAYKFLLVKNEIGWDSIKKAYANIHKTYGKNFEGTKLEQFDIWTNELTKQSGQEIKALFTTKEWNALLEYCGAFTGSQVQKVTISNQNLVINKQSNTDITLTANMTPNIGKLDFTSSNPELIQVVDGKLNLIKDGKVTITAKSRESGKEATCNILLDRKEPEVTISYSSTRPVNTSITVTIKSKDEEIIINDSSWQKVNEKEYKKEYNKNTIENVQIQDIAGNIMQQNINVENIDKVPPVLNIEYSNKNPTNQTVDVKITANEKINNVLGFELSEDRTVLTKTFINNYSQYIIVEDLAGNTSKIFIDITNIDKEVPTFEINYSTQEITNENIFVTIKANEEITIQNEEFKKLNEKEYEKEYFENTKETIIIQDTAGNTVNAEISIENIDKIKPEITINYSTKELTNQDVKVTINSNEQIQEVEGFKLLENNTKLEATFSKNTSKTIEIKDIAENAINAEIIINNIDKIAPKITVEYSTKEITNKDVIVTIASDKEIKEVDGWNLSENKKSLTKTYKQNTEENIVVTDNYGNTINAEVKIDNIDKIAPNITIQKDITELTNKDVTVKIVSNEELKKEDGWKVIDGEMSKTYEENTNEKVEFEDLAGNKTIVEININNIDKVPAKIEVDYVYKDNKVNVILTSSEEIQKIDGWTLDNTRKSGTKRIY